MTASLRKPLRKRIGRFFLIVGILLFFHSTFPLFQILSFYYLDTKLDVDIAQDIARLRFEQDHPGTLLIGGFTVFTDTFAYTLASEGLSQDQRKEIAVYRIYPTGELREVDAQLWLRLSSLLSPFRWLSRYRGVAHPLLISFVFYFPLILILLGLIVSYLPRFKGWKGKI